MPRSFLVKKRMLDGIKKEEDSDNYDLAGALSIH